MAKKITSKDIPLYIKERFNAIRKKFWSDIGLLFLSFFVTLTGAFIIKDGNFSGLTTIRLILIFFVSILAALINYEIKEREKKKQLQEIESKLDIQYDMAFRYSSLSIFNLHKTISKAPQIKPYIEHLLFNVMEIVRLILEANLIEGNTFTANLMIESPAKDSQRYLEIIAFGCERPGRKMIKLVLNSNKPLPGAPTAFIKNITVYIANTADQVYNGIFDSKEYLSFVSIPISENEDDGNWFAVLNIDSPIKDQFVSDTFFAEKIYPALKPSIALIKLIHKIGLMDNLVV